MNITVIDSIMGSGKSTWAFRYINSNPRKKFIYITPFLEECNRATAACASVGMKQPNLMPTKQADFLRLVREERNIAATHSLFCQLSLSRNELERIREIGYTLIVDEVFETVQPTDVLTKGDLDFLIRNGYIEIAEDGTVMPSEKKPMSDLEKTPSFEKAVPYIKARTLIRFENKLLLRVFPIQTLELAQDVYILTYLFDASHLRHTLDMNDIPYDVRWMDADGELTEEQQSYAELKRRYKALIHIYDGRMNAVGNERTALSSTKWKRYKRSERDSITNGARNFFMYRATGNKVPAGSCLWAVYGEKKKDPEEAARQEARRVNVEGYSTSCIAFNERATNQYRDRYVLSYLVNVYEHVEIKKWFMEKGIECDDDSFALSIMLQWIWRSRIRNGGEIYLYLPSRRMRTLLNNWLDHEPYESTGPVVNHTET